MIPEAIADDLSRRWGLLPFSGSPILRGSLRQLPKRLRTLLLAIPLLSNTISSETGLVTAEPSSSRRGSGARRMVWANREPNGRRALTLAPARANGAAIAGE